MFTAPAVYPTFTPSPAIVAVERTAMQGAITSDTPEPDRFVILAGYPFHGKTTSALTFENPLPLDFDHKIPRRGVESIPFWDDKFVDSIISRKSPKHPANRRDALTMWLADNARFLKDRTPILDGLSAVETAFHQQTEDVEGIKANIGGGELFGKKLTYFNGLFALLANIAPRVVVTCHLAPIYTKDEKTGADVAIGKSRPVMTGQFAERIAGYATSMILCERTQTYNSATNSYDLQYWWHLKPSSMFDSCTLLENAPAKIPADYKEFRKLWT